MLGIGAADASGNAYGTRVVQLRGAFREQWATNETEKRSSRQERLLQFAAKSSGHGGGGAATRRGNDYPSFSCGKRRG
ncbi:unnamed protein product [Sphagnum jensenii]